MIETEPRPLDEDLFPLLAAGGGGDGWSSDDAGDGWGWSEEPEEDDDDGPPYRRSRVMRVVSLVTVTAVVLGSIGTWVVFLAVGSPKASFTVSSIEATVPEASAGGSGQQVLVRFEVANESNTGAPALCRATLTTPTTTVGTSLVRVPRLAGGQWARESVLVPVDASALSGHGSASARVRCQSAS